MEGDIMNRFCNILCFIIIVTLLQGCSVNLGDPAADDLSTFTEKDDNYIETEKQEGVANESETDSEQCPEQSVRDKELLYFDSTIFYFGKTYSEIQAEFADLEYKGYITGGEYFYSLNAEMFFGFPYNEINNPQNPNGSAEVTVIVMQARRLFPNMGTRIDKGMIEKIVGAELEILFDDFNIPNAYFLYQGYEFRYNAEETLDLFADTFVDVRKVY